MALRPALARRLRSARKSAGLSTRQLDAKSGLTPGHVWAIEAGERVEITADTAKALARALGCSLDWLLCGEGVGPATSKQAGTDG